MMHLLTPASSQQRLAQQIAETARQAGGWLGFDRFMELALYTPGLGYYASGNRQFGWMPASGSDFVTAPELSPLFAQALARQVAQALQVTQTDRVWEFGAGSGALALHLIDALDALGVPPRQYCIVEVSGSLRQRQQQTLARHGARVVWLDRLPQAVQGVLLGNEVLDAMPVKLLARCNGVWHERGVVPATAATDGPPGTAWLAWQDRPTTLRPPLEPLGWHGEPIDYLTEIHPQAEAFVQTLIERLWASERGGALFLLDYGFPELEYYHPQRRMGTVMCHRAHRSDTDPLADIGDKDITAHVNFTGIALAAQTLGDALEAAASDAHHAGKSVGTLGYTSQSRFLLNCGLLSLLERATQAERAMAAKLIHEHEMGELFKVIGLYVGTAWDAIGFAGGDRCHTL